LVFRETKEIINEAVKKYEAFVNFYNFLDKKILAFQRKKVEVFQEKHELKEEYRTEFMKGINERKRLVILEERNINVDPSSSRWAEEDFAEMDKITETLKPSENKIKEIKQRLETLKFSETKQRLNHEVDILESMFTEVQWSLVKASLYEKAHSAQEELIQERLADMKKRGVIPQHEGYLKSEDRDTWKKMAETEYEKRRKKYYENLEKIQNRRKKEQERKEWNKKKRLYKELERRKEDEKNEC